MKQEQHDKALEEYLKSEGKISNVDLAKKVGVTPLTIGRWKKNWKTTLGGRKGKKVTPEPAAQEALAAKKTKPKSQAVTGRGMRKQEAYDKARAVFEKSGGKIGNTALAKEVSVSLATIAAWKKRPDWKITEKREEIVVEKVVKEAVEVPRPQRERSVVSLGSFGKDANNALDGILKSIIDVQANLMILKDVLKQLKD